MIVRTEERRSFDQAVRVSLLEGDMDHFEDGFTAFRSELDAIRKILIGILVSVTTASLLLAVNVIVVGSH